MTSTRGQIARELLALAWPAALQGLVTTVILFADRLLLGRYSTEAIASISIAGPVIWSTFSIFLAFAAGIVAVVGRAVGAGDRAKVRATVPVVLIFAAVVGVVVGGAGWILSGDIASLMAGRDTSLEVQSLAVDYMAPTFVGAPLHFVAIGAATSMQAGGDTRTPMWVAGVAGLVNLLVGWVLIYGHLGAPELGVTGAAFGTVAAYGSQAVLGLAALTWSQRMVALRRPLRRTSPALRSVLRVSIPTFGEKVLYHSAYMVFTMLITHLGDVAMAAHQALIAIEGIGFVSAESLGIAAGALVAMKLGASEPGEAKQAGWLSAGLGGGALLLVSMVFVAVPELCVGVFTQDPEVIALGAKCLRVAAIAQPLMAITDALAGALRGAGDTRAPMVAAIVGPVVVRITLCWFLAFPMGLGLLGIWIGSTADWATRAGWLARAFHGGRWQTLAIDRR